MPAELGLGSGLIPTKIKLPTVSSITQAVATNSPVIAPGTSPNNRGGAAGINPPSSQQPTLLTSPTNSTAISGPSSVVGTNQVPGTLATGGTGNPDASPVGSAVGGSPPNNGPTGPGSISYTDLLNSDPLYQQLLGNLSAAGIQANQTQQGETQQAIEQFGEVPDLSSAINGLGLDPSSSLYSMIFGDITPDVSSAANTLTQNGLSTTAGLDRQHATDIQSLLDSMAARGTVQSGGTGVGLGQADQTYNQNEFGARTSLINYLTGVQQAFNQSQQSILQQQQQGVADALQRQLGLNPGIQVTGSTPAYVPVLSGQTGSGSTLTGGLGG